MDVQTFLQHFINALQWGSFYALIALGYTLVYGVLRLINFAHGDIFMVGAYIGFFTATFLLGSYAFQLPFTLSPGVVFVITLIVTMTLTSGVGVALERVAYRPLRRKGAGRLYVVITALMAGIILENGNLALLGASRRRFPDLIHNTIYTIGGGLGGFLQGFIEIFIAAVFPSTLRDLIAFSVLLIFLSIKPTGIFGVARATKI